MGARQKEFSVDRKSEGWREIGIPSPDIPPLYLLQKEQYKRYCFSVCCLLTPHIQEADENVFHLNYVQQCFLAPLLHERYPHSRIVLSVHYVFTSDYQLPKEEVKSIDKVICLSNYTYQKMSGDQQIPIDKLIYLPNGLADSKMAISADRKEALRRSLGIESQFPLFLYVGRLDVSKGITLLLKAFRMAYDVYPNMHLLIVGNGHFDQCLAQCSLDLRGITFTGKVPKEELSEIYQLANIGIHPSLNEQCSYVAIEMLMHGIPLIAYDSTGMREMIEDGRNGYKIPVSESDDENVASLVAYILKSLEERKKWRRWKEESRCLYEERFTLDGMKNNVLHVYYNY
jgi:glycosyltransferase involved in cell wall biosynthesis